jgi:hypothetical protein
LDFAAAWWSVTANLLGAAAGLAQLRIAQVRAVVVGDGKPLDGVGALPSQPLTSAA